MTFTYDWFTPNIESLNQRLDGVKPKTILEIGCYEGRSAIWFLERFPEARIVCVDTFEGSNEHKELGVDFSGVMRRFLDNTAQFSGRVELFVGTSDQFFVRHQDQQYDLIYVDGSHVAADTLRDMINGWQRLVPGGYMVADDYGWNRNADPKQNPKAGIDAFISTHEVEIINFGYQVILKKNGEQ